MVAKVSVNCNGYHLKPGHPLPPRVRETWGLLAQGLTNQEAADRMHICRKQVENYVNVLYHALGLDGPSNSKRVKAALLYRDERA